MFNALLGKVYTGILTLSMVFFSNYTGNDVSFSDLFVDVSENSIYLTGSLVNAFENDFDEIFRSGIITTIYYDVSLRKQNKSVQDKQFTTSVKWDSSIQQWIVYYAEQDITFLTNDFQVLKKALSKFETVISLNTSEHDFLDIVITARLPEVHIPSIEKKVDLMLLWKLKHPQAKIRKNLMELK